METETSKAVDRLSRYIRARYPVIYVVSHEENRVLSFIRGIAENTGRRLGVWTITHGIQGLDEIPADETHDPVGAMMAIEAYNQSVATPTLFVMLDFHNVLEDAVNTRYVRDIASDFEKSAHNLILVSPTLYIPSDLDKLVTVLDFPLPDVSELTEVVDRVECNLPEKFARTLNGKREEVIRALQGLTGFEAENCLLSAVAATGELGETVIPHIVAEKKQIIRKSGVMEFYEATTTLADVGGLDLLKHDALIDLNTFSANAREKGVDMAKGIIIVGVPGTGKSLLAKSVAAGKMPVLRLDIGAVMGKHVGESEGNIRQALRVAEAVSPCVLWIDEVEKALGGTGTGENDGGTTLRVFGTILTWLQENTSPVYAVCTANDVRALKPEFLRRFDAIYWVDLPSHADRLVILGVHLNKRGYDINSFEGKEIEAMVKATWGLTGAEIEKAVKSAVKTAYYDGKPLSATLLIEEAARVIPIAKTMEEQINSLRNWAATRAKPASSFPLEAKPVISMAKTIIG